MKTKRSYKLLSLLLVLAMAVAVLPTAAFAETAYDLYLGQIQVTSANKDNIPVSGGTASFDPTTDTLFLNGVTGVIGKYLCLQ